VNNAPPSTRSKRRIWIAFLIIGGSMAATGLYFVLTTKSSHIPFDSERWKEVSFSSDVQIRQMMVLDLQRNVLHRGMTRHEVESLLGSSSLSIPGDHDLAYELGSSGEGVGSMNRFGGVSRYAAPNQWLTLTFNEHDRLVEWNIVSKR
jgi:hypothetical protein